MKKTTPDWILSAIMASAGFLAAYIFIGMAIGVSLVISSLCFASGLFLFQVKKNDVLAQENDLAASLADGKRKLDEIRGFQKQIAGGAVTAEVNEICVVVQKILAEVKRDPGDLKAARQFLSYYLDATINILRKYVTLSSQNTKDEGIVGSLKRTETMLDTIHRAFEKQLARLLSNDVMDLDIELSLLEKTINMEGLGE
jgi:5-bromo-4-chloroindolyl phosphate hydrolysis protein